MKSIILIGYSGHALVVADAAYSRQLEIKGYIDSNIKSNNPFGLSHLGTDTVLNEINKFNVELFVSIGDNNVRKKIFEKYSTDFLFATIQHGKAVVNSFVTIAPGTLVAAGAIINPLANIGKSCIINTGAIIEHECIIGDFTHIAPGTVLAGNVTVGDCTFIGANSVVKQGINIGNNVTIGAGSVIIRDVPDGVTVVGNPGRVVGL